MLGRPPFLSQPRRGQNLKRSFPANHQKRGSTQNALLWSFEIHWITFPLILFFLEIRAVKSCILWSNPLPPCTMGFEAFLISNNLAMVYSVPKFRILFENCWGKPNPFLQSIWSFHLVEISTFLLYKVTVRPTKMKNRADKYWAHF